MTSSKPILLAEDNPRDAELALAAMEEHHLADKVILCHDGAEVLDYLYCRGHFKTRLQGNPAVVLLDLKMPKVDGLEVLRTIKGDAALKPIPVGHAHILARRARSRRKLCPRGQCLCGETGGISPVSQGRQRARCVLGNDQRTAS